MRKKISLTIFMVVFVTLCFFFANSLHAAIPQAERDALIALYNDTTGDSWTANTNWRDPVDPLQFNAPGTEGTWYGITLAAAGTHVEKIVINFNNLTGTIPDMSVLTGLKEFRLVGNNFSGSLPTIYGCSLSFTLRFGLFGTDRCV